MTKKIAQFERDFTIRKLRVMALASQEEKDEYVEKLRIDLMDLIEINHLSTNIVALTTSQ